MIKDFVLAALIIILNHWVYGVEDAYSYNYIVEKLTDHQNVLLAGGTISVLIMLLSLLNMAFYAALSENLMRDKGYLVLFVMFAILGASCISLRIIDFNYHTKNAIVPISVLAAASVILVEFVWPVIM
jgi:uncharacterized YccA/Bax inhibitor family protein